MLIQTLSAYLSRDSDSLDLGPPEGFLKRRE